MWSIVKREDPRGARLADRHYSRQTIGARGFLPPGRCLALLTDDARAVWGVVENLDILGARRWRCTIFRNEGPMLSSVLISIATVQTFRWWREHYGGTPGVPLRTEIDAGAVRRKRDPGRCFLRAGWTHVGWTPAGHGRPARRVLQAPDIEQPD